MQAAVTRELLQKLSLAVKHGLVPPDTQEFEFTLNLKGQGIAIEYWPCSERKPGEHTTVHIPRQILNQFVFHTVVATLTL